MIFLIIVVKGGIFAAGLEIRKRSDARVAEEARLESVYTSKAYRGFESPSLRTHSTIFFVPSRFGIAAVRFFIHL